MAELAASGINEISTKQDTLPAAQKTGSEATMIKLRRMFDVSRSQTNPARVRAELNRDYYDGPGQLNSEIRRVLRMRKQPAIYTNRIRPAVNGILGTLIAAKSDPRAFPRTPQDDDKSDVATKILRYINDTSHFDETKLDVAENYLIEGIGAVIIEAQGNDIPITQIRFEEYFYDPYSRRNDFKDAKYQGIAKWMYADDVRAIYPEAYAAMGDPVQGSMTGIESTWNDKPDNVLPWVDVSRRRLMVVELYYNEVKAPYAGAEWYRCVYCAAGIFEEAVSPYLDDRGSTVCPIEAISAYVDRNNNRYGPVCDMIPIQDEVNARRSRSLHLVNSRQIQQTDPAAAPVDSATARLEAAKADGVLPPGWGLVPTSDMAKGNMEMLQEAKSEIERMGPTPAILGRTGSESQSGRARQVLQQAGMTELARPLGRLEDWELRCYKQMWFRAKQYWKAPMFIRVTDDKRAPEFLQLNAPVMGPGQKAIPATLPDGTALMHPDTGEQLHHIVPSIEQVGTQNQISEMDMDIILDTVQDTANLEQEVWSELMQLAQQFPPGSPEFMIAIELSPLANKREVIERIEALTAKQQTPEQQAEAQQQKQIQQTAVGLQLSEQQAKVESTQAGTQKDLAEAARTRAEVATMLTGATDQAEGSASNGLRF